MTNFLKISEKRIQLRLLKKILFIVLTRTQLRIQALESRENIAQVSEENLAQFSKKILASIFLGEPDQSTWQNRTQDSEDISAQSYVEKSAMDSKKNPFENSEKSSLMQNIIRNRIE